MRRKLWRAAARDMWSISLRIAPLSMSFSPSSSRTTTGPCPRPQAQWRRSAGRFVVAGRHSASGATPDQPATTRSRVSPRWCAGRYRVRQRQTPRRVASTWRCVARRGVRCYHLYACAPYLARLVREGELSHMLSMRKPSMGGINVRECTK